MTPRKKLESAIESAISANAAHYRMRTGETCQSRAKSIAAGLYVSDADLKSIAVVQALKSLGVKATRRSLDVFLSGKSAA